jgi:antitoxin component YwqK of YwqJK toxin-antitoxin module
MRYIFVLFLFVGFNASAQCKDFIISVKGDTLNCTDMKGLKQGPWVVKVESLRGERGYEEEGFFKDGMKNGTWRRFSLEGDLIAIENYRWGQKDGRNMYMTYMGEPLREETWRAIDPLKPYDTVNVYDINDPTKVIGKRVVKMETLTVKHGTWKYYGEGGTIEKTEEWVMDKPKPKESDMASVEDDLAPIDVSTGKTTSPKAVEKKKPQAVLDYEKKNAGKKKIRVRDGSTGG